MVWVGSSVWGGVDDRKGHLMSNDKCEPDVNSEKLAKIIQIASDGSPQDATLLLAAAIDIVGDAAEVANTAYQQHLMEAIRAKAT